MDASTEVGVFTLLGVALGELISLLLNWTLMDR